MEQVVVPQPRQTDAAYRATFPAFELLIGTQTDLPGIYAVTSLQPAVRFAVNLDAAESRTAPMPVEELLRLGVPMKPPEIELTKQAEQKRRLHNAELENQQKLWRWLIVAALVVLLFETWLAGRLTRRALVPGPG